jgi:hypothetical protein
LQNVTTALNFHILSAARPKYRMLTSREHVRTHMNYTFLFRDGDITVSPFGLG